MFLVCLTGLFHDCVVFVWEDLLLVPDHNSSVMLLLSEQNRKCCSCVLEKELKHGFRYSVSKQILFSPEEMASLFFKCCIMGMSVGVKV